MSAAAARVTAVVLGGRGGADLERTLASVSWAARRHVVSPSGDEAPTLPPELLDGTSVPAWVLLLREGEEASPRLAEMATRLAGEARRAFRIPVDCEAFGRRLRVVGRPVRLAMAPRGLCATLAGDVALDVPTAARAPADAAIVRRLREPLEEAVEAINAESTQAARLAAARGMRPGVWRLVAAAVAGGVPHLVARADAPLGWGRWIAAVLAGYRGLVAATKLWERRQLGSAG